MQITGRTVLYFTIGHPVAQVRAPEVFNRAFADGGVDAVVVPALVAPQHLEAFVRATFASPTVQGFFVSIPHKAPLLALADRATPAARRAGAANAARRAADGAIEVDLLDGEGFVRALRHFAIAPDAGRALLLGAGGAACAIGAALALAGARAIDFYDSAPGKAAAAAARIGAGTAASCRAVASPDPAGCTLVVNATPMGLKPDDPLPVAVEALAPDTALVDIIMTPRPTRLVELARRRGLRAHPGYEMLIQQVPLYLRFFGHAALADRMESDLSGLRRALAPPGGTAAA
ncbi:MAG: shikimate dehydrogenase [Burkholderiales bacterium]|nr:shikimate dehydrogenase [Burkholderiales bacterium]